MVISSPDKTPQKSTLATSSTPSSSEKRPTLRQRDKNSTLATSSTPSSSEKRPTLRQHDKNSTLATSSTPSSSAPTSNHVPADDASELLSQINRFSPELASDIRLIDPLHYLLQCNQSLGIVVPNPAAHLPPVQYEGQHLPDNDEYNQAVYPESTEIRHKLKLSAILQLLKKNIPPQDLSQTLDNILQMNNITLYQKIERLRDEESFDSNFVTPYKYTEPDQQNSDQVSFNQEAVNVYLKAYHSIFDKNQPDLETLIPHTEKRQDSVGNLLEMHKEEFIYNRIYRDIERIYGNIINIPKLIENVEKILKNNADNKKDYDEILKIYKRHDICIYLKDLLLQKNSEYPEIDKKMSIYLQNPEERLNAAGLMMLIINRTGENQAIEDTELSFLKDNPEHKRKLYQDVYSLGYHLERYEEFKAGLENILPDNVINRLLSETPSSS